MTISMLKRQVEKEFVDLYPFEDPLVCSKLEDSYGYALSNVSRVEELLVSGDRIMAVPISKRHDGRTLGSPRGCDIGGFFDPRELRHAAVDDQDCRRQAV